MVSSFSKSNCGFDHYKYLRTPKKITISMLNYRVPFDFGANYSMPNSFGF